MIFRLAGLSYNGNEKITRGGSHNLCRTEGGAREPTGSCCYCYSTANNKETRLLKLQEDKEDFYKTVIEIVVQKDSMDLYSSSSQGKTTTVMKMGSYLERTIQYLDFGYPFVDRSV